MIQFWLPKTASWGPFGAWFGQIPADSGRFGRVLFERPHCVLAQTPPLWAQHVSKVSPKALKTSEKLPRTSYHDPTKFRWIKFPRSGFLFQQIWRRSSGALCLLHAPCAITIANSKKKHLSYQSEGRSFSGCGGLAWASSINQSKSIKISRGASIISEMKISYVRAF